jgi:death-on-curing protein
VKALATEQVLRLHESLIERFGGEPGLRDLGLLQGALARPFAEFGGVEAHTGVHEKAGALLHGLASNHPFVDGNKRVALAATLVFLQINGYRLALDQEQRYELTMRVADGSLSQTGLASLLHGVIDPGD